MRKIIVQIYEVQDPAEAESLVKKLRADGLIIHLNPMQEWFQPEGDILDHPPIDIIRRFIDHFNFPVIVKEVGQGMGPESLKQLMKLPLQAIEFGAFGGTNFARVELLRDEHAEKALFEPLSYVGENAYAMLDYANHIAETEDILCRELIVSGGIKTFLDGYYMVRKSSLPAIYGMASTFLKYAQEDYEQLRNFVYSQVKGLELAYAFLTIKE